MKYVYILQKMSFNTQTNQYQNSDNLEAFSSDKKLRESVNNCIEVNKGINVKEVQVTTIKSWVNYDCLSVNGLNMKVRYVLTKLQVN